MSEVGERLLRAAQEDSMYDPSRAKARQEDADELVLLHEARDLLQQVIEIQDEAENMLDHIRRFDALAAKVRALLDQ